MNKIFWEMSSTKIPQKVEVNKIEAEKNNSVEVAYLIAKFLKERGVDRIFGICGGHILPIWDYLNQLGIKIIDVRDERIAVHMAQAYTELTGNIGVATVTAGPGMTNAVTGIANAHISRVPLLVISGIPPRPQKYMNPLQELPQVDIVKPICRYARTIAYAPHVLRELDEAFACAKGQGNEPGPSFIDFPTDLLRETLSKDMVDDDLFGERKEYFSIPDAKVIDVAVEMLWSAGKPLIMTGRGARGSQQEIIKLLDMLKPVYLDTTESRGMVPDDHPSNMPASRGRAMEEADVLMTIGRSMDFQLAYGSRAIFPNTRFIRIGTCAAELRMNRRGDVEIWGTVSKVLEMMIERGARKTSCVDKDWIRDIRTCNDERRKKLNADMKKAPAGSNGAMHPYRLLGAIRDYLNKDAIIITDGGDILSFARISLNGGIHMDPGGFGCLGVGVPFGICAALVHPDRQVIVVVGDGAFGLSAMDIDTAKRHKAKVVFVVANNASWSIERNDQIERFNGRIVATELPSCDYAGMARSLGLHGERIEDPSNLASAIDRAFKSAPALLDVVVSREASSPDAKSGLPIIPDFQPLGVWDQKERARIKKASQE